MAGVKDSRDNNANEQAQYNRWQQYKEMIYESYRGAISLGNMAFRAAILLNGAAAIAVLAFISSIWDKSGPQPEVIVQMGDALKWLVIGTTVAVVSTGFGYLRFNFEGLYLNRQVTYPNTWKWLSYLVNIAVILAVVGVGASYVLFAVAMFIANDALFL